MAAVSSACTACFLFGFIVLVGAQFDEEVEKQFIDMKWDKDGFFTRTAEDVLSVAKNESKPVMFMLTKSSCMACIGMKDSVNSGNAVKGLLDKFLVIHAQGKQGEEWREMAGTKGVKSGIPQMYWFDSDGFHLNIAGTQRDRQRHYFSNDAAIAQGMHEALVLVIVRKSNCSSSGLEACSEKEVNYINTWKAKGEQDIYQQLESLDRKSREEMKPEQAAWMRQRMAFLEQMLSGATQEEGDAADGEDDDEDGVEAGGSDDVDREPKQDAEQTHKDKNQEL